MYGAGNPRFFLPNCYRQRAGVTRGQYHWRKLSIVSNRNQHLHQATIEAARAALVALKRLSDYALGEPLRKAEEAEILARSSTPPPVRPCSATTLASPSMLAATNSRGPTAWATKLVLPISVSHPQSASIEWHSNHL